MPTTLTALAIFVLFVMPGMALVWAIKRYIPSRTLPTTDFVVYSLFASVVIYGALFISSDTAAEYLVKVTSLTADKSATTQLAELVKSLSIYTLAALLVSALLGLLIGRLMRCPCMAAVVRKLGMLGFSTASDWLFAPRAGWVTVRTKTAVYRGHVHFADASSVQHGGLVLRKNLRADGIVEPVKFVFLGNEHEEDKWVPLPHEWVYLPFGEMVAIWAMPIRREEAGRGEEEAESKSQTEAGSSGSVD